MIFELIYIVILNCGSGLWIENLKRNYKLKSHNPDPQHWCETFLFIFIYFQGITWENNFGVCSFPFRYKDILYYACTNITLSDEFIHMCAGETDLGKLIMTIKYGSLPGGLLIVFNFHADFLFILYVKKSLPKYDYLAHFSFILI